MKARFPRCPNCGSYQKSMVGQCKECYSFLCNNCDHGGGLFKSRKCPRCDSSRITSVGRIIN